MSFRKGSFILMIIGIILALALAGCDNPAGDPGGVPLTAVYNGVSGSDSYNLVITEDTNRYAAQSGDAYVLTVTIGGPSGTVKMSIGTVSTAGATLSLTPNNAASVTFTVTVSGAGITAISGTITFSDNTTQTAPTTMTPGGGTDPDPNPDGSIAEFDATSYSENGSVFRLVVTDPDGKTVLDATDTYVLTYTDNSNLQSPVTKTSTGVYVSSVSGSGIDKTLTLRHTASNTNFTVDLSSNLKVTRIAGTVTFNKANAGDSGYPTLNAGAGIFLDPDAEVVLTRNFTASTTLGVDGRETSYVWDGGTLNVQNDVTLTVKPRTTIRFSQAGGQLQVQTGGTISALGVDYIDLDSDSVKDEGEPSGHIVLKGGAAKGSWEGVVIQSTTENALDYVEILNAGGGTAAWDAALYLNNGSASVTNCIIDSSQTNGITTYSTGVLTAFDGNTISNSEKAPIYAESNFWSLRNITADNAFTGNTNQYIHVASAGSITANMTIPKLTIPYRLDNTFTVNNEAKLTVEPGTEIRFGTDKGIYVNSSAAIVMDGTEAQRILLRGVNTTSGSWGDIEIHSNRDENSLSYVDIQNGGGGTSNYSAALYLFNGVAGVNNCTITGSGSNGITTYGEGYFKTFSENTISNSGKAPVYTESTIYSLRNIGAGNTLTGNAKNYVHISTYASIIGDMTLKKLDVPYFLEDGLNISDGNGINPTLTIEPGTHIWVDGQKKITVDETSKLVAVGTAQDRIVFRGSMDQAGFWHGIVVHTKSEGTRFNYCDISGGGRATGYSSNNCLFIWAEAYIDIRNTAFSKSNWYYVGFDDNNSTNGYHIFSQNVTFDPKGNTELRANVWYEVSGNPTADALPLNNFTPSY